MGRTFLLGFAALSFLVLSYGAPAIAQKPGKGKPQPVIVAAARLAEFVDRVEALGTTRANETVRITATVTETIVKINFDDGQRVRAGDVLVELEKSEEEADLRAAEAIVTERRLAFDRARDLESRKFTATAQLDERRAALQQAEAQMDAIKSRIDKRVIRAPFDGIVDIRNISVGALVEPGDLITTLYDLSVIKVDVTVPATYLATLKPGLPILAKARAVNNRTFQGELRSIGSQVDPVSRSIIARAVLPNPDGLLRPGLLMTVELLKNARQAVIIPEEALIPRGRDNFVLIVDESAGNKARRQKVSVGARRPGEVEILDGLEAGQKVVTHGTTRVRPGQTVTITSERAPTPPSDSKAETAIRPATGS